MLASGLVVLLWAFAGAIGMGGRVAAATQCYSLPRFLSTARRRATPNPSQERPKREQMLGECVERVRVTVRVRGRVRVRAVQNPNSLS